MSQLENFKGLKEWNLDTDNRFLEAITASTDSIHNGIKGVLDALRDLEKRNEDCYIHLKHAVNWMTSLNYSKFIENKIQEVENKEEVTETPITGPKGQLSPEQLVDKYRKAIDIALTDLNLKDLKADDNGSQIEGATLEGLTMAAGGNYVTAHLKGRIPFLIGSKEFGMHPYIGLEVNTSSSLTEKNLKDLKGEAPAEKVEEKIEEDPQKAYEAMTAAVEEVKSAEASKGSKMYDKNSYAAPYSSKTNNLFGLAGADDEDEVLPQYKEQDNEVPIAPDLDIPLPPQIDVPEPPAFPPEDEPKLPPDEVKKDMSSVGASLFVAQEQTEDFTSLQARTNEKTAPKADYKQRMNKLFGLGDDDEDDEKEDHRETTQSLISLYQGESKAKGTNLSTNLFGNPETISTQPKVQPKAQPALSQSITNPPKNQKNTDSKGISKFFVDDDDDELTATNTKKVEKSGGLFSDD